MSMFPKLALNQRLKRPSLLHQQVGLGLLGTGAIVLLGVLLLCPTVSTLTCDRQAPYYATCSLSQRSLLGLPLGSRPLDPLQGAQPFPTEPTQGFTNRILLYANGKDYPFSTFSVRPQTATYGSEQINNFLGNNDLQTFRRVHVVPFPLLLTSVAGSLFLLAVGVGLMRSS